MPHQVVPLHVCGAKGQKQARSVEAVRHRIQFAGPGSPEGAAPTQTTPVAYDLIQERLGVISTVFKHGNEVLEAHIFEAWICQAVYEERGANTGLLTVQSIE